MSRGSVSVVMRCEQSSVTIQYQSFAFSLSVIGRMYRPSAISFAVIEPLALRKALVRLRVTYFLRFRMRPLAWGRSAVLLFASRRPLYFQAMGVQNPQRV